MDKNVNDKKNSLILFINNIYMIYESIKQKNNNIIDTEILLKQYLAYYLYRIIMKFIHLFSIVNKVKDLEDYMKNLNIPENHDKTKLYPLVKRMINNKTKLDIVILMSIDMFNKVNTYINTLHNASAYSQIYLFLQDKNYNQIIQDLNNLQKLIPSLPSPNIKQ